MIDNILEIFYKCIHFCDNLKGLPQNVTRKSMLDLCKIMNDKTLRHIYP